MLLFAVFEEEMARLGDERLAVERTAQRFGDPADLAAGLQESITLSGHMAWLVDGMNHNRLYNVLLGSFALFILGGMWPLLLLLQMPADVRPRMHLPDWSLPILAVVNAIYLVAMFGTLIARLAHPVIGKRLTTAMNVLFLIAPPVGTALGIYGLWKVDKNLKREAALAGRRHCFVTGLVPRR